MLTTLASSKGSPEPSWSVSHALRIAAQAPSKSAGAKAACGPDWPWCSQKTVIS
jgi:hypothetical protein